MRTLLLLLVKAGALRRMVRRLPSPLLQLVRLVGMDTVEVLVIKYLL